MPPPCCANDVLPPLVLAAVGFLLFFATPHARPPLVTPPPLPAPTVVSPAAPLRTNAPLPSSSVAGRHSETGEHTPVLPLVVAVVSNWRPASPEALSHEIALRSLVEAFGRLDVLRRRRSLRVRLLFDAQHLSLSRVTAQMAALEALARRLTTTLGTLRAHPQLAVLNVTAETFVRGFPTMYRDVFDECHAATRERAREFACRYVFFLEHDWLISRWLVDSAHATFSRLVAAMDRAPGNGADAVHYVRLNRGRNVAAGSWDWPCVVPRALRTAGAPIDVLHSCNWCNNPHFARAAKVVAVVDQLPARSFGENTRAPALPVEQTMHTRCNAHRYPARSPYNYGDGAQRAGCRGVPVDDAPNNATVHGVYVLGAWGAGAGALHVNGRKFAPAQFCRSRMAKQPWIAAGRGAGDDERWPCHVVW